MNYWMLVLAALGLPAVVAAEPPASLTALDVKVAIEYGRSLRHYAYQVADDDGKFALLTTRFANVANAAFAAKSKYEEFGPGDVTDKLMGSVDVHIVAGPYHLASQSLPPTTIVIVDTSSGQVLKPHFHTSDKDGYLFAHFERSAIVPKGEVRVVYVPGVERRWQFSGKDIR